MSSAGAPAPANYSCGRCRSGGFAGDMEKTEAVRHAAMVHNVVVRKTQVLAVRPVPCTNPNPAWHNNPTCRCATCAPWYHWREA